MSTKRETAIAMLGAALSRDADTICKCALVLADLGGGVCCTQGLASETSSSRAVVVVVCGPIPDDLVEALGSYVGGLAQDLKTSGKIKTIYESE